MAGYRAAAEQRVRRVSQDQRARYQKNEAFGLGPENFGYEHAKPPAPSAPDGPVYRGGSRPRPIPNAGRGGGGLQGSRSHSAYSYRPGETPA